MVALEQPQDMDELLKDMCCVAPGMICAMSSSTGAGKKRALTDTTFNARQLGDAHALLRQLIRGMQPGATNCVDGHQRELALAFAPYLGIQRPQAI